MIFALDQIVPTLILGVGVIEDLRTKKVRNATVIACALVALASSCYFGGATGVMAGLIGGFLACFVSLPLVFGGVLGAGDMKIFVAFGLATGWNAVITTFIAGLVWGAILGVVRVILMGRTQILVNNLMGIFTRTRQVQKSELNTIPYTVALLFGWLSAVMIQHYGGIL